MVCEELVGYVAVVELYVVTELVVVPVPEVVSDRKRLLSKRHELGAGRRVTHKQHILPVGGQERLLGPLPSTLTSSRTLLRTGKRGSCTGKRDQNYGETVVSRG